MGARGPKLNGTLKSFIERQHMFFVATAARDGRVNVSPKGLDSLKIMDDNRIVWLNLTGSGNETAAHLKDVNRMTLMFCAFESDAMILRVYGTAKTVHAHDDDWDALAGLFPPMAGSRQIFDMSIDLVQTSCGTGVPFMEFVGQRGEEELVPFWEDKGPDGTVEYWRRKNMVSLDGAQTGLLPDG